VPVFKKIKPFPEIEVLVWEIIETAESEFSFFQIGDAFRMRLAQIAHPHRRIEYLASRAALNEIYPESTVIYQEKKPLLTDGSHVSFSHNVRFGVAARSLSKNLGVDLESERTAQLEKIKHKFLSAQEAAFTHTANDLHIIWGAKEALFKLYGHGSVDFLTELEVHAFEFGNGTGYTTGVIHKKGGVLCDVFFTSWQNQYLVLAAER
jgi:4'-phosphopantetheinyl transferase